VIESCAATAQAPGVGITSPIESASGAASGPAPSVGSAALGLTPTGAPSRPSSPSPASVQVHGGPASISDVACPAPAAHQPALSQAVAFTGWSRPLCARDIVGV